MNHAPAILAAPALIYSMHRLLVVWIIVTHFHLCSLLDRCTVLEVWVVWRPMRVYCGSWWGRCVLFINIWESLMAPWLVYKIHFILCYVMYNMAMYTVYGRCGQYGRCMFIHWPVRPVWPVCGLYGPAATGWSKNRRDDGTDNGTRLTARRYVVRHHIFNLKLRFVHH